MYFRLTGWAFDGELPDDPKLVVIGYPHTSNWDFFAFLAVVRRFDVKARFLAHEGLFKGPFAWLLRRWGAIPVQGGSKAVVSRAVAAFESSDSLVLVLAPEGTRAGDSTWKSGFWRIADGADVPVVMGFIDRETKRVGFGPAVKIDGDIEAWMEEAKLFYADKRGLKPENRGPLELARSE